MINRVHFKEIHQKTVFSKWYSVIVEMSDTRLTGYPIFEMEKEGFK